MIVAAHAGTGKTTLSRMYPHKVIDFVCMPYKYILSPDTDGGESGKANPKYDMNTDWPYNYVEAILETLRRTDKIILIPPIWHVLHILSNVSIPYILCYPQRSAKEEYKRRYISRGNTEDFLYIFIGGWNRIIGICENDPHGQHIILKPHEFLSDVIMISKNCKPEVIIRAQL